MSRTIHGPAIPVLTLALLLQSCKAATPRKVEIGLMNAAKHKVVIRNKTEKNPIKDDASAIAEGQEAFSHYCVACHGLDGQNTGVPFADRMSPPVPSLTGKEVQSRLLL